MPREHSVLKPNAHGLPHTAANQPPPIALSEAQMLALLAASYPLPATARAAFLEACAKELAALPELGDGILHRMIMRVQKLYFDPPDIDGGPHAARQFPTLRSEKNLSSRART
jgi:hypothetical protein